MPGTGWLHRPAPRLACQHYKLLLGSLLLVPGSGSASASVNPSSFTVLQKGVVSVLVLSARRRWLPWLLAAGLKAGVGTAEATQDEAA